MYVLNHIAQTTHIILIYPCIHTKKKYMQQVEENGVVGIHLFNSNNFTFVGPRGSDSGSTGQGFIGSTDGPQPLDVLLEGSSLVTFNDVLFQSVNGEREQERVKFQRETEREKEKGGQQKQKQQLAVNVPQLPRLLVILQLQHTHT